MDVGELRIRCIWKLCARVDHEDHHDPHARDRKDRPARGVDLLPARLEAKLQPAPPRAAQAESHRAGPPKRGQSRRAGDHHGDGNVLPGPARDLESQVEPDERDESEHHLADRRGELQRVARQHRVVVEIPCCAPARPGRVQADRDHFEQDIDDPDAKVLAALAREHDLMGVDAGLRADGGRSRGR